MKIFFIIIVCLSNIFFNCLAWERDLTCPVICTCQIQHITETAIYRFMQQKDRNKPIPTETGSIENNEVIYDENLDTVELLSEEHRSIIIRSATCILQTETSPLELVESLPDNIESITLIQGYESGNKTIKFSYLSKFTKLLSLELVGPNSLKGQENSHLLCEIDEAFPEIKYMNLERVLLKNSKTQTEKLLKQLKTENVTFEYIQKIEGDAHPITFVQKSTDEKDIVPYKVFKQQEKRNGEAPLFIGFKKLILLRIANCELNNIHWEMFDGLNELQYLILERNRLHFIPAFAFYGTPNLKSLSLAHNNLLDIQITDLAGLLQLEFLDLTFNNFTQLSELSLPPFPKLKLANFANNPISVIFPNTFEVMNTTDSLIIGSDDIPLTLITNSFVGLNLLKSLTLNNLDLKLLKREFFVGMPKLSQLLLTGSIKEIEFDAFLEVYNIEKLTLSKCRIMNLSMDSFIGLQKLKYLDLSHNELEYLPPGVFDHLIAIKELYLNGNKFKQLPRDIFSKIHPKLLRLNENPWHCSCEMSDWKPMIVNKIRQKVIKPCEFENDKGTGCVTVENRYEYRYIYENKIAPKCAEPEQFINWNLFHAMRRILKCPDYKPKTRKHLNLQNNTSSSNENSQSNDTISTTIKINENDKKRFIKSKLLKYKLKKQTLLKKRLLNHSFERDINSNMSNDLNPMSLMQNSSHSESENISVKNIEFKVIQKAKKYKKRNQIRDPLKTTSK